MSTMTITPAAAEALGRLLEEKNATPSSGLRLAVRRGGCAGWQYEMKIAEPETDDEIVECEGGRLIIDAGSLDKLSGCRVNYSDSLSDAGFRIENPNAARSCGCGTSFESASDDPADAGEIEECR